MRSETARRVTRLHASSLIILIGNALALGTTATFTSARAMAPYYRGLVGCGTSRSLQIARTRPGAISRWRGIELL